MQGPDVAPLVHNAALLSTQGLEAAAHSHPTASADPSASTSYILVVDGVKRDARTDADTWAQALNQAGVHVDTTAGDQVSVSLTEEPKAGVTVTVNHATVTQDVVNTPLKHERVEKKTDELYEGESKTEQEGSDGVSREIYTVTTVDGKEISRTLVSSMVVTPKVDEVVLVGTKPKPAPGAVSPALAAASTPSGGTNAGDAQAIAHSMMGAYGWGEGEFQCLVSLWNRESGWNYAASNSSSGAYGIPQALPGSKMASAGADWATNPATQISWGLGYIAGRYGSPCGAWSHSESVGWY
nr:G5 domain-containing protein [Actinomyces vulturis]